ncbi:acetyl-CoA C-acetyltransferase [Angomonas deanei]|uniref:Thiolase, N-terminal domain/Beta-ketoacyl synthase, N-terminal domain/Thiolase, C-terminal domain containing protein, putative n=1 Tax=Angomonas deanei TaxID=59799 RepID=A0A7G2C7U1_9TRYP|nr:acetyl-CoA C-acetyltransferase [Angomonas deanei]CAD2214877.1 Thiolase, N-terminal domain/Beta-ketoacyl synthase, N-terminal domain/Thiolase, C-terminal domain containing protein, putative [Angomonas deanei]|eukprot:EPY39520.1 acetyl-CoA C-acetyltransferase [Angomonas deanei]
MSKIVICGAARTPVGAIAGGLAPLQCIELGRIAAAEALKAAKCDVKNVEYVTFGHGMQDVRFMGSSKMVCDLIGTPVTTPATTVQENCASGGAAIHDIARRLLAGEIELGLAGGMESMSNAPRFLFAGRIAGQLYGSMELVDGIQGGLKDPTIVSKDYPDGTLMGVITDLLAEKYGVSRELQDQIAYNSHKNAFEAWEKGMFDYVTPVEVKQKKKTYTVSRDEGPKKLEMDYFTKQKPFFRKGGTVTVANSSSTNDAAACLVLATEKKAKDLNLPILAELHSWANIGVPKEWMGEGAFKVIPKLFQKTGLDVSKVDFFEMNEAFAAVVGAATKDLPELADLKKVNQWGSGISIGHPIGCTGVRQVVDMVHQLRKRDKKVGITSRCVGGGIGSGEVVVRYD